MRNSKILIYIIESDYEQILVNDSQIDYNQKPNLGISINKPMDLIFYCSSSKFKIFIDKLDQLFSEDNGNDMKINK